MIPKDELDEIIKECTLWKQKEIAFRKQLQALAGKLQHLTKCIKPASRFTNRVLAVLRETPFKGLHKFNRDLLLDLDWFCTFAKLNNGLQLLPPPIRKNG